MTKFIIRWIGIALALYLAIAIVPGLHPQAQGDWLSYLWLAAIFGIINAFLGTLLKILTCLINILTLGLFTLVINTFLFWFSGYIGTQFGVGFTVDNFLAALLGSIVVSIVSLFLNLALKDDRN